MMMIKEVHDSIKATPRVATFKKNMSMSSKEKVILLRFQNFNMQKHVA